MAWLLALDGPLLGSRFSLGQPCLVGRGPLNHVVIDDPRVSRQHAKISPEAGGHLLHDLASANGTYINDVAVNRQKLVVGDIVRFGPFHFRFEAAEARKGARDSSPKVFDVHTMVGIEPAGRIVGSLDAVSVANPQVGGGLSQFEDAERKLRTLYAFMQSISTTLEAPALIERIAASLLEVFPAAAQAIVYLREEPAGSMAPRAAAIRDEGEETPALSLDPNVQQEVLEHGRAILAAPARSDALVGPAEGLTLYAPMIYREAVHGVLVVKAALAERARFAKRDLDLLTGLALQAAMALQNVRMHAELLRQQRLARDLAFAEEVQKSFLPRELPQAAGLTFAALYQPAYSVGGDFYDAFWLGPKRLGLLIGDVVGQGVPAALLMARISSDLRLAALAESDPAAVLARVNRAVLEREQPDIFVTAIYLTLDIETRKIVLANAGHPPPLVRRPGRTLEVLDRQGATAIGFFDDVSFEQFERTLEPADTLVLYTDGVIEAMDAGGQPFGQARLEAVVASESASAQALAARVVSDVTQHVGGTQPNDDVTLLICQVEG